MWMVMPDRMTRLLEMRRFLASALMLLVLVAGPVYPYIHLAAVPHRYCPRHHTFEKVASTPPDRAPNREKDESHDKCPIAALVLVPFASNLDPHFSAGPCAGIQDRAIAPDLFRRPSIIGLLAVAPKQSPPA